MNKVNVAIFASGNGTNALNLIDYFDNHSVIQVAFVFSNNPNAPVISKVKERNIKVIVSDNKTIESSDLLIEQLNLHSINYIILAGFLRKIPTDLIDQFNHRIINIHPSLLPKFGGAGMYGIHVHNAVKQANEKVSGITIHFVSAEFDKGQPIAQFYTSIKDSDTAIDIQQKVKLLEHMYFPFVIEKVILSNQK